MNVRDRLTDRYYDRRARKVDDKRWSRVRSLEELGQLTADWLEGGVGFHPGGYDESDPETIELIPALAAVNRAGFATTCSQPGEGPEEGYDGWWWWQCAAVDDFADPELADEICAACEDVGLVVIRHDKATLRCSWRDSVEVTVRSPYLWSEPIEDRCVFHTGFGAQLSYSAIETEFRGYPNIQMLLYRTPQLTIIDPKWARNDLLWPTLTSLVSSEELPC